MTGRRFNKWFVGGVALALAAAVAAGIALAGFARASVGSSGATKTDTASAPLGWSTSPMVERLAQTDGVGNLSVLVSAGSGSTSSAVIVGSNDAGQSCWTVLFALGAAGSPFRCGTQPGDDPGQSADQAELRIGCEASGAAGSTTADSASCIGFASSPISTVEVRFADGSSQTVDVTNGAFAYQADSSDKLPDSIVGHDSSGQTVAQREVIVGNGPGAG